MDIRKRMDELINLINKYNEAYYQNNESLISDLAFDQLLHELQKLENENPRTVQDMLRGNTPGLDVSNNASPRGGGSFLIRGRASLTAATSPLIVVDGVIYPGSLNDINPNDIEMVDVLKDASSASVFGARSANGVILVTTKKGKSGKPQITLNSNFAMNKVGKYNNILNQEEFLKLLVVLWVKREKELRVSPTRLLHQQLGHQATHTRFEEVQFVQDSVM